MSRLTPDDSSVSLAPSALADLSTAQQQRLAKLLDRYLAALESGTPLNADDLLTEHPDLAKPLRAYFRSLDDLHDMAAGIAPPTMIAPARETSSKRIGDFELLHEIGRGGMGVVYEARQISLDRRVAVKLLPFTAVLDSKQIARFKNEAQAAAQLHHPNIVPVFAIGAERGIHFYAMQFIDGQPLDKIIEELRREAALPPVRRAQASAPEHRTVDDLETVIDAFVADTQAMRRSRAAASRCRDIGTVLRLGIQAAEALHAAHEYGVVHRDVKPANLLLDANGKLWITDFGLARVANDRSLTRTGDIVGTRRYMSPEQASGNPACVDHRSDIYALGVTLYELLTLRAPGDESTTAISATHEALLGAPPSPRRLRPDISADLETVILKAMAKERDDRYATAQALADDLRCVLDGKPTVARPPTWREKLARWSRGNQQIAAAAFVIAVVAVLGLTISLAMIANEKAQADKNLADAKENFREAQQAVDLFGARLAERLAAIPGTTQLRRELLRETVQYYQRFTAKAGHPPKLRADLATAYCQVAALANEDGSTEEALAALDAARTLLERLVEEESDQPQHARRLVQCLNNLALSLRRAGRDGEARAHLLDAIHLADKLPDSRADLALAYGNLGLVEESQQRVTQAEFAFRAAIRLLNELNGSAVGFDSADGFYRARSGQSVPAPAEVFSNSSAQGTNIAFRLATEEHNLAALLATRNADEAEQLLNVALARHAELCQSDPSDARYPAARASTLNCLAALQVRNGRREDALQSFDDAIRIQTKLVDEAANRPSKQRFQHELAISLNNRGLALDQLGESSIAEDSFRQSLTLHETLLGQQPNANAWRSSCGGVFNNLGSLMEHSGRLAEAADAYAKAIEHQRRAVDQAPQVAIYRSYLSKHLFNRGRVLRALGRDAEAAQTALERREIWPDAPSRWFAIAEELALAKQPKQALDTLEQAVAAGGSPMTTMATNESFASLRGDARFAKLLASRPGTKP